MRSIVRLRRFLCFLFLGLCLVAAGLGSAAVLGMPPSRAGASPICGCLAVGFGYDGANQGSIRYDNSSDVAPGYK
jgi:hypothetical protein